MKDNVKISIVDEKEKYEKVKLVKPNIIYNRFDIKYNGSFDVLKIEYNGEVQYVSFHIDEKKYCFIGLYMTDIEQVVFNNMLDFLTRKFKKIRRFKLLQCRAKHPELDDKVCWMLDLPDTVEEYWAQFSAKSRYNRKREFKKLCESFNISFEYYKKEDLTESIIKRFFDFKQETKDDVYYDLSGKGINLFLSNFFNLTDTYVLKINGNIEAIIFYSITDSQVLYCENMAYNKEFASYNIGQVLFYYSVEKLIERKFKCLYVGGGNYEYKRNCHAIKYDTGNGIIKAQRIHKKILNWLFECVNSGEYKIITLFGIKLKFRKGKRRKLKIPFMNKILVYNNVLGTKNRINVLYKNKKRRLIFMHPDSILNIEGNNNTVNFHFKTGMFPKGLKLKIDGSNNNIDIYKSSFEDATIKMYRDDNTLLIKQQSFQPIANATIYVGYGGSIFIGEDCELGNGGLELAVAGDYKEKHKMVIGDHTHIARDAIIRTSDGQSLIDPKTNLPTDPPQDVIIGNHVWIMSRCIILKGSYLADGCAVAANSLVNKQFVEQNVLIGGTPAKVMKKNIRWDSPYGKYMERLEKEGK